MNIQPSPELVEAASLARARAYAPHSGYQVGAAIRGVDGEIYSGCNVENDSYGLTICAERSAVSQMVLAGCYEIVEVVVITADGGSPCGMCRQTLVQFAPRPDQVTVFCLGGSSPLGITLAELLPHTFRLQRGENPIL